MKIKLQIVYRNWNKANNQGLCDFKEVAAQQEAKLEAPGTGAIYRAKADFHLKFVPLSKINPDGNELGYEPLFFLKKQGDEFKITDLKDDEEELCALVGSWEKTLPKPTCLRSGTRLKLGKVHIEIIALKGVAEARRAEIYEEARRPMIETIQRISFSNYQATNMNQNSLCLPAMVEEERLKESQLFKDTVIEEQNFSIHQENPACKVCLSRTIEANNYLIALCECKGSSKFVHEQCLKTWIQQRADLVAFEKCKKKVIFKAAAKAFICEVCKSCYSHNEIFSLIFKSKDIQINSYMVFRVDKQQESSVYMVDLEQIDQLSLGREATNDIKLDEITVSRHHCRFLYNRATKELTVVDLESKFGTVVKRPSIKVTSQALCLQKGRTFMKVTKIEAGEQGFLDRFLMCSS